jgi:hypothetical protein
MLSRSSFNIFLIFGVSISIFSLAFLSCSGKVSNTCTPQCDGKQCSDDKCGGNCGLCEDPAICQEGQCILPGECQPSCDIAQCRVCFQYTCESLCHGSEVCNDGICEEPICDPPCDGNTKICSNSVCKTFAELKNDYIASHPGQAIIPYPWEPITSTRILPFDEVPAAPGNEVSISACRDEFEAASFVITAQKDLSGITLDVPNLVDAQGNTIPASAIDVRLIKVWYQGSTNPDWMWYITPDKVLTPELLLKDDSLVSVDYVNKVNTLKVTINGSEQMIDISNPAATFPSNAEIHDAATLQPFSLKATENKQIWVTVHVPSNTPAGNYSGNITINASSEAPVVMNLRVTVLPFNLEPAPVDYGLYYVGIIQPGVGTTNVINSVWKSSATYLAELQNMKDHGVLYPTLYQQDNAELGNVLTLRDATGLPKDKIFLLGTWPGHDSYIGNGSTPEELAAIAATVTNWRNITESHGYTTTYFYGIDERKGDELLAQRPAWQTVHNNGGKMFVACSIGTADAVGDLLDAPVLYGARSATEISAEIAKFHGYGQHVFTYGNPQAGIENPVTFRKNYGFALWNSGYDGAMDFAYQYTMGQSIWNDYDDTPFDGVHTYRDHVFAYPTSDGVIDTVEWEGWREGADDTRYLATLKLKMNGDDTLARSIVADSLSKNESMSMLRKRLIKEILSH